MLREEVYSIVKPKSTKVSVQSKKDRKYWKRKRYRSEKRIIHKTYNDVFSFENLYEAGLKSCKNVRWKASTIDFESNLLLEVQRLYNRLHFDGYKFEGFRYFRTVEHGKMRDINALTIQDRTVQRCLCDNLMTEAYSKTFVYDNSASLPNKGMDLSLRRLVRALRKHYKKHGISGGVLQFDFKSFFASLVHTQIKRNARKYIKDKRILKLLYQLVDDFNTMGGDHGYNKGVGLGSQVSQNIALEYPNIIDHFFKDILKVKGYGHYMDDGYVIGDIQTLSTLKRKLLILSKSLGIKVNSNKTQIIRFRGNSFSFLKFRYKLSCSGKISMKVNRNGIKNMRRKIRAFRNRLNEKVMCFQDILSSYQSWRAHCKRGNSFRTLVNMDRYFCTVFNEELKNFRLPFKCTLNYKKTKEGYIYNTKFLLKEDKRKGYVRYGTA